MHVRSRSSSLASLLLVTLIGCANRTAPDAEPAPTNPSEPVAAEAGDESEPAPEPDHGEAPPDAGPPETETPSPETPSPETPSPETPSPDPAAEGPLSPRVRSARSQLSATLGVPESSIGVVNVEAVRWNNGALGCPEPGMAYTQALVDGYLIVLEHDGTQYSFHGANRSDPFPCPRTR